MPQITITISRTDVFDEVNKATDYTAVKLEGATKDTRDRILANDQDLLNLQRFWTEAAHLVCERFKDLLISESLSNEAYTAQLEVSVAYDTALNPSVEKNITSFFIDFIIGEWFKFSNKNESQDYTALAAEYLTNAERLLYSRKRPVRPSI